MAGQLAMLVSQRKVTAPWPKQTQPARQSLPWLFVAYGFLALLLAAPLLAVEVPLGGDTLNHLARIHVRAHIADDPDLARLFEIRDVLIPYMGLDWLLTPLARVMPTLVVGRIAVVLLLWGMVGAVLVLQRTFTGRIGFEPLLMGLVSYNSLLAFGFLNYMLGVVGAILGLAAWHAMRECPWLLRLVVFTVVATALYFVHLLALALYGAMLAAYEVFGRPRAWQTPLRDWALLSAQFAPAAMLWVGLVMPSPLEQTGTVWHPMFKMLGLMSPFLFSGALGGPDSGIAVLTVCVFLLVLLTRRAMLRWNRRLAVLAAALMLVGLVMPTWIAGVFLGDVRLPATAACMAIAAVSIVPGKGMKLWPLGALLAAAVLVQTGSAGMTMLACDRQYGELRAALQDLPKGVILTPVQEDAPAPGVPCSHLPVYHHMAQLITLERSGYSPDFFSNVTTVAVRNGLPTDRVPLFADLVTPGMLTPGAYLLWIHLGNHDRPLPAILNAPARHGFT